MQQNAQGLGVDDCAEYPHPVFCRKDGDPYKLPLAFPHYRSARDLPEEFSACYCPLVKAFACLDDEPRDHLAECRRAEYVGEPFALRGRWRRRELGKRECS